MVQCGAIARPTLVVVLALVACSDGPTEPPAGPPTRLEVTSGAAFSGAVGTLLAAPLTVRVLDAQGRAVRGADVSFSLIQGGGSLSPETASTDRTGEARTRLTFGPVAGAYRVHATVSGLDAFGSFIGEAVAGAVARVVVTPAQVRLVVVGDTMRLRAREYDSYGNARPTSGVTWAAADPDVFTIDQAGLVTGMRELSVGRAIGSVGGRADTAYVVVANPDASPCLGYPEPVTLGVGQSIDVSLTDGACIRSAGVDDEYVLIPWNGSTVGSSVVSLRLTGSGLTAVTGAPALGPTAGASLARASAVGTAADPARAFALEESIREMGRREVMPLARRARQLTRSGSALPQRSTTIPTSLSLGDFIDLNANARASCTAPTLRTARVAAVSARAIVVHDTANPAGGFTDADYQRFAITFDTLVAPVDEAAFGSATDIDRNGKVVIFFTRAVNELTPASANFYYGGFFHPRDLLPREQGGTTLCAGSNEGEMFYMLVPDPAGTINNNVRRVGFVDSVTTGTLAHEFQHLINAGRRAYVNDAVTDEEVWLNEGLSHIAEELVFYHAARISPRRNIGGASFGAQPFDGMFMEYMAPNFGRLRSFLQNPQSASPYAGAAEADLATRGAAWAFLRYAADRRAPTDGDVWMRLVNSSSAGLQNLRTVFGADVLGMVRDWTVSLYTDDYVPGVPLALTQPSWDFRSAFPVAPASRRPYPLVEAVRSMSNETPHQASLRGGAGAFWRFAITPDREASIRVTSGGVVPPPTVRATIVRRQ